MKQFILVFIMVFIYISLIDFIVWFSEFQLIQNLFLSFVTSWVIIWLGGEKNEIQL